MNNNTEKRQERKDIFTRFMNVIGSHDIVLTLILALLVMIFTLINPNFIKSYNLLSMAQTLVPYAIITLGVIFVIASGNTDLSLGSVCIASAVMAGKLYAVGVPLWEAALLMVVIGAVFGAINGFLVAKLKIPSFIATLGTMMFVRGLSAILVVDPNIFFPSGIWYNRLFSNLNGFPTGILWLTGFVLIAAYIMYKNRIGRYILAIGSNPEAARLSGIRTEKILMAAYIISGISAGIAGIFWSSSFATVAASTGNGMEFDAIAAVYIGGTGAAGGSASVTGSVLGMMLLTVIRSGLNFALSRFNINVNSTYVTYVMTGVIIVGAILTDIRKKEIRPKLEKKAAESSVPKKLRLTAILLAAVLLLGALLVCVTVFKKENGGEKPTVAVIAKGESITFWLSVRDGCMQAGKDLGYNVTFRGPQGTDASYLPESIGLVQTALSNSPVAMGLVVICEGHSDILEQVYDAGIPVVEFDSGVYAADKEVLDGQGKNPIVGKVATNNYAASALAAENVFPKVRDEIALCGEGEYLVGVIQYEQNATAEARVGGFVDRFRELAEADPETAGKYDFTIEAKPDDSNNNYRTALEALAERGSRLIFAPNQTSVNQVRDAVLASGGRYDDICFAGFDCGTKHLEWLRSEDGPRFLGAVAQDSYMMGYKTVENAVFASLGRTIESDYSIDGIWYDETNCEELLSQGVIYEG